MSNKVIVAFGSFILGAAAGVGGAYFFMKKKYEQKMLDNESEIRNKCQEKINEMVKDVPDFGTVDKQKEQAEKAKKATEKSEDILMKGMNYNTESSCRRLTQEEAIEPNDYEEISVTWYNDDVVYDDGSKTVIENFEDIIGEEGMDILRNVKEDAIYIANEERNELYFISREPNQSYEQAVENGVIDADEEEFE